MRGIFQDVAALHRRGGWITLLVLCLAGLVGLPLLNGMTPESHCSHCGWRGRA